MATTYVSIENLTRYDGNLKTYIDSDKTKALKALGVKDNAINFYVTATPTDETVPDFTVDMPIEYFLDQNKTTLVQNFVWSESTYPSSTDPNLEGKPVLVLAVKGDNNTVTYSFLNMETLVDTYVGESTSSITLIVSGDNKISAEVNVSATEGNAITIKDDGIYVPDVDLTSKADKLVADAIKADQILVDDGNGNITGSGKTVSELSAEILATLTPMSNDEIDALFN